LGKEIFVKQSANGAVLTSAKIIAGKANIRFWPIAVFGKVRSRPKAALALTGFTFHRHYPWNRD
jgi:hypothetical protein